MIMKAKKPMEKAKGSVKIRRSGSSGDVTYFCFLILPLPDELLITLFGSPE